MAILRYKANFKVIPRYSTRTAVNLSYRIYGEPATDSDETTIILLHGLLGSKKHWDGIGKTILNVMKKAVVSVDLRNHGDSPHVNSHKYEDQAADILKLLNKMSLKRASLIGHSMGGRTAMAVSLTAPDKIAGILVVDISPISTASHLTEFLPTVLEAMKKIDFKKFKSISAAKKSTKQQLKAIVKDDLLMNAVLSNIKMKSDHTIGWACNTDILIKHFKYIAAFPDAMRKNTYYGPTLFIGGQLSEYLPPDDLPGIREMFPRAVVTYVPQAGHNLHVDDPKSVLDPDDLPGIREMFPRAVVTYVPQAGHNLHVDDPKTFLELAIAFLRTNK